jgi:hypothetical protein
MQRHGENGFVLPAVLAYIAAFMLIVVLAANALERAQDTTLKLETQNRLSAALDDIEAQAAYAYLTSTPVPGGVELFRRTQIDPTAALMGTSTDEAGDRTVGTIWRADNGELKFTSNGITGSARYRDVGGLISLNSTDPLIIARMLEQIGISGDQATGLAATLRDYTDEDSLRRPRGGEAADYRLRQKRTPTNSPLRDVSETVDVLGWDDLPVIRSPAFIELVTVSFTGPEPRWVFSPEPLRPIASTLTANWREGLDPIDIAAGDHAVPGARARLSLSIVDPDSGIGRYRMVEIERLPTALTAPYSRLLVYETSYSAGPNDALNQNEVATLDPFGAPRDD